MLSYKWNSKCSKSRFVNNHIITRRIILINSLLHYMAKNKNIKYELYILCKMGTYDLISWKLRYVLSYFLIDIRGKPIITCRPCLRIVACFIFISSCDGVQPYNVWIVYNSMVIFIHDVNNIFQICNCHGLY